MKKISKLLSLVLSLSMLASMLVIPSNAINDVMDIPAKSGCYMTLETNKHSLKYLPGDDVVMTVRLHDANGNQISAPYIRYNLRADGSNEGGYSEYQLNWITVPFKDGEYTIKTKAIDIPGFMRLRVDILDESKKVIKRSYTESEGDWSEFGPSGQMSFFQAGIVVDVENIRTTASTLAGEQVGGYEGVTYDEYGTPSDFMSFWSDALSELDIAGNAPKLIELAEIPLSTYSNWYRYNHELYSFKVSCPGDPTDLKSGETYVTGTIQIPKNVDLASAPIEMWYCGYGITNPYPQGSDNIKGRIAVTVAAHSLDYDFVNKINSTSDAFNLHADQQGDSNYYGFSFSENQNRENVYFKYMLLRDIQAVRFVTKAFREDGVVEFDETADEATRTLAAEKLSARAGLWDGESISSNGSSQGAFQAVAVSALYRETIGGREQRITELWAGIPWMCDVQGNTDSLKVQSTYRQYYNSEQSGVEGEAVGLNYYDTANFGRFVQCDTTISAGMGDPLCPASGVSALYNNIRTNGFDKNVTLGFTQGKTHSTNLNSDNHKEERVYTYKTTEKVIGYTDAEGNFEAMISSGVLSIYSLGDDKVLTGTAEDAFVTYLAEHTSEIKEIKLIGKFAEIGDTQFMFGALKSATSIKIDYRTDTVGAYNTTDYAGNFIGMSKLSSFGHVEFDSSGNIIADSRHNTYEEGVCDLRGFDFVINHTADSAFDALPHCIFRGTGVKKVILPDSLMCGGTDVAGKLPVNGFALCSSLVEVTVPSAVKVSELGEFFFWRSSALKTIRFEGGVSEGFTVGGSGAGNYPTNDRVRDCIIYCPSSADTAKVNEALTAVQVSEESIKAVPAENTGFTINSGVLTIPYNGDSGIALCDATWYGAMGGVTEVKIEDGYKYLGANIFDMSTVSRIHIPESVTDISPDCFGKATDFTIVAAVGSYAESFAKANGISFKGKAVLSNAITADGFNVRTKGYTGLRGLFTFSDAVAADNNILGYTLVEYGALACSGTRYASYGYDPRAVFDAASGDERIKKIVVEGEGGVNRFVDSEKKQFCISLVGIAEANYLSDVYMCGYQVWTDGENEYFFASEYIPESGTEHYTSSLYGLTLFGFKGGLVNSETMEDACLWDVLSAQAVTLSSFSTDTEGVTATVGYELEDGAFTFKNLPLLAYSGADESAEGSSFLPTGLEKTSTTGIEWSLIADGADYIAVFRLAQGIEGTRTLPRLTNNEKSAYKNAHMPFSVNWGKLTSAKDGEYAINSPMLSTADIAKVKTVIIDYGIDGHRSSGLSYMASVETIVYPNGYTKIGDYGMAQDGKLKNVIWANDGIPHMEDVDGIDASEGLLDLRGMENFGGHRSFYYSSSIKNIVFSSFNSSINYLDATFHGASGISRVWMTNADENGGTEQAPGANILDLRGMTGITELRNGVFEIGSGVRSIYLPDCITSVNLATNWGANMTFGNGRSYKIYSASADFKEILGAYYTHVTTNFTGTSAATLDNITVNDLPIKEYLGIDE